MKRFLKSFLGVSSKEVNGLLLLIIILIITLIYPRVSDFFANESLYASAKDQRILDSLIIVLESNVPNISDSYAQFKFDPNTISPDSFALLGFSERASNQIVNYRSKGGRFRIKSDLYKIYSIDSSLVNSLYGYINLPTQIVRESKEKLVYPEENSSSGSEPTPKVNPRPAVLEHFDINKADTAMLQTISGIGTVLSKRIVSFRDMLGGFVDREQLYEVYNLDSSVVLSLNRISYIDQTFKPKYLRINSCTEEELRSHPYLNRNQARLIVAYRNQHGDFLGRDDLEKVYGMDEFTLKRILPYISWAQSI